MKVIMFCWHCFEEVLIWLYSHFGRWLLWYPCCIMLRDIFICFNCIGVGRLYDRNTCITQCFKMIIHFNLCSRHANLDLFRLHQANVTVTTWFTRSAKPKRATTHSKHGEMGLMLIASFHVSKEGKQWSVSKWQNASLRWKWLKPKWCSHFLSLCC